MERFGRRRGWAITFAAAVILAALPANAGWRVFASQAGRFEVEFPEHPKLRERERGTPLGAVRETKHIVDLADETHVAIEVHDMPWLATRLVPSRSILDQVRSGILEDSSAVELQSQESVHQGEPAIDFTFRLPNLRVERALAILVDSRLYVLTGRAADAPPDDHPTILRFFDSFRFWREGETPDGEAPGAGAPPGGAPGGVGIRHPKPHAGKQTGRPPRPPP
ncbi:MAG: hypothetical protein AAF430_17870, partial [Myxococcota bacterium]